jgi:phosphonopyruvate decarboxylase
MIASEYFINLLSEKNIDFFTGVPDSLLKSLCAYITDNIDQEKNIIAVNEGAALGLAAGYYLGTGKIPTVYMQNSGLGNAVNPLLSLTDKEIYNIPVLLLVGWRGKPGIKDEPQHRKQGRVTVPLLDCMEINHVVLSKDPVVLIKQINEAYTYMWTEKEPFAFIIEKDTFEEYTLQNQTVMPYHMNREQAIQMVVDSMDSKAVIISTTGMISRELFEYREKNGQKHNHDFLAVGSMGHASQIGLGIALQRKDKRIYCFDGDGAVLMHMGVLATIGVMKPDNYVHVVFNNGAHDSVGGQPTVALDIDLCQIASACGYNTAISADTPEALRTALRRVELESGPVFLEIKVNRGARKDLGRPTTTPIENKEILMKYLMA